MLADTQLFFIWIAFMCIGYWLLPSERPKYRQIWLLVTSFVYVFAHAPFAALLVLWMTLVATASYHAFQKKHNAYILWFFILMVCLPLLSHRTLYLDAGLIATLGITFATLKAISLVIDGYSGVGKHDSFTNALYMFFLPLFTVGPIDKAKKFAPVEISKPFSLPFFARGITRTSMGLFKSVVIADGYIRSLTQEWFPIDGRDFTQFTSAEAIAFILLSFLFTYVNFSAFIDIAIGVARLFGFEILENFRFPLFAKNLQDFWRRWHISLGNWITNYLYMPIVFMIGKRYAPYIATFLAFSLIGWWHDSSVNYILWGVLHGIGLGIVQFWLKWLKKNKKTAITKNTLYIITSWAATLFFVAWVQTVANLKSAEDALAITLAVFRFY